MVKIIHEKEKCIGCGACVALCPSNWEMGSDNKSKCKNTSPKEVGCNKDAAEGCPVSCIIIKN